MELLDALRKALDEARRELLDLTARNRLIHTPRKAARVSQIEIVSELSDEIFRRLVRDRKSMAFLPASTKADDASQSNSLIDSNEQVESSLNTVLPDGVDASLVDDRLQTSLATDKLQSRLLKIFYDARTFEEEQGVGILYLAMGFLKWYESDSSAEERYAPLLLLPVELTRTSVRARFRLAWTEDDLTTNLSAQEKFRHEFAVRLPNVPEADDLMPSEYFASVCEAISGHPRWEVLPNDVVLGFFSFSKFLMYRDLQPENWPEERAIEGHPLIRSLLREGFLVQPAMCGEKDKIDPLLQPLDRRPGRRGTSASNRGRRRRSPTAANTILREDARRR